MAEPDLPGLVAELEARLAAIEHVLVVLLSDRPEAQDGSLREIIAALPAALTEQMTAIRDVPLDDDTRWPLTHRSVPYLESYAERAVWSAETLRLNATRLP